MSIDVETGSPLSDAGGDAVTETEIANKTAEKLMRGYSYCPNPAPCQHCIAFELDSAYMRGRAEVASAEERGRRSVFADPEALARRFHETYERLAPEYGYETRKESAVPWEKVPEKNRRLMIAVCAALGGIDSESGRRSGVEEADGTVRSAVRLALACAAEIADSIDNIVTRRVIARRIRALIPPPQGNTVWPDPAHDGVVERLRVTIDAALAPRDSGDSR